jgi:hypothetical protein
MTKETTPMTRNGAARIQFHRRLATATSVFAVSLVAFALAAATATAATPAPGWTIDSFALPSDFSAADNAECLNTLSQETPTCDAYRVTVAEAGSAAVTDNSSGDGSAVMLSDQVPAGLTVQRVAFFWSRLPAAFGGPRQDLGTNSFGTLFCTTTPVQCQLPTDDFGLPAIAPDDQVEMVVYVTIDDPSASGSLTNSSSVSGGDAPAASASSQNTVGSSSPSFGAAGFSSYASGADGQPATQAGDHPYELTTRIDLANERRNLPDEFGAVNLTSTEDIKDVVVDLPLGLLGSALATPQCTFAQLSSQQPPTDGCPADTRIGTILTEPVTFDSVGAFGAPGSIFNMVPEHGVAAEFAFDDSLGGAHVLYARAVPSPAGYVLQVTSPQVAQIRLTDVITTFFGNPAARDATGNAPVAMFTNPSVCDGQPLKTTLHMDSWLHPGRLNADGTPDLSDPNWTTATSISPRVTGCNKLSFQSTMTLQPDTTVADSPSGVHVDIKVPQTTDANTLATPPLKDASVTLPPGFTVDPSSADGLGACSPSEIALGSAASPTCPDSSKIGTVELTTPLLPGTLTGSVYLASQFDNPFHSLLAGYIVVDDAATGVVIKIPGNLTPDPQTGQITGVFDNNPQFPFSELKLDFNGGSRGVLATPESCGAFTATSVFSPWSAPDSGPAATPSDSFSINSGCVSGFAPSFTAGTTNPQAGRFSPFVLALSRSDTDQNLQGLTVKLPPGMLAKLAGVSECSEAALASISSQPGTGAAQAANPSCPANSQVGTVEAGSGVGPSPFFLGGKAYLTGPYKGAPYGLAVVVPAVAGPLDLGTVVVRQALYVDPTTAQVTAVSDQFPTILDGIPLRVRRVDVNLNRPNFTFNPTNCDPMAIMGLISSTGGLGATLSPRFQVGGCAGLSFKPRFSASTQGHTTKANGASLTAKLSYPNAPQGTYTNITKVKVELPKQLPSRLTTLQKACTNAQFEANPAGCPPASFIGHATVHTPLLPVPLTGPAIFVSHGGEAFPSLVIVLQGNGVTIDLVGTTFISKAGVTSTTFKTVPDTPFNDFELTLPQGKFSALASNLPASANGSFCGQKLVMPSEFVAQNGAVIRHNTAVTTTGCAKKKALSRKQKLAAAMKACKKKAKGKRAGCARQARRKYGPVKKHKKK